ncbi:hypothetical protein CR513_29746, partial [Mucuna pruriens]
MSKDEQLLDEIPRPRVGRKGTRITLVNRSRYRTTRMARRGRDDHVIADAFVALVGAIGNNQNQQQLQGSSTFQWKPSTDGRTLVLAWKLKGMVLLGKGSKGYSWRSISQKTLERRKR